MNACRECAAFTVHNDHVIAMIRFYQGQPHFICSCGDHLAVTVGEIDDMGDF